MVNTNINDGSLNKDTFLLQGDHIADNLTLASPLFALSANQGKVLNDRIEALTARVEALEG